MLGGFLRIKILVSYRYIFAQFETTAATAVTAATTTAAATTAAVTAPATTSATAATVGIVKCK